MLQFRVLPILKRRHAELFLKHILKMTLTGE